MYDNDDTMTLVLDVTIPETASNGTYRLPVAARVATTTAGQRNATVTVE